MIVYFHCTDGVDMVVDRTGQHIRDLDEVAGRARAVAQRLMRALPDYDEWGKWAVHAYDAFGEVAIIDFPRPAPAARSRQKKTHSRKAGSTEPAHAS
jgi:hypothetical protein